MLPVTNRSKPKIKTIKIGSKNHSYKTYSWGAHEATFGPLKDTTFNSKAELKAAMEAHPTYNDKLQIEHRITEARKNPKDKESGLNKNYVTGLSASTAKARKAHWDKADKLSDRDPRAYEPAPGDATAKTRPSKATREIRKIMSNEEVELTEAAENSLSAKAKKFGVSIGILKKVYSRGVAAWNSGHRPGTTPQQWGHARVNAYLRKGKGTYHGADKDLREDAPVNARNSTIEENVLKKIFGKKDTRPAVEEPKERFPSSNKANDWMSQKVAHYTRHRPNELHHLFSPASGDYMPTNVHVGSSWKKEHEAHYNELKKKHPEAIAKAKEMTTGIAGRVSLSRVGPSADFHGMSINEDAPANAVGGGNVAGLGVGPQGEPPGKIAAMKKTPLKRFKDFLKKTMK